MSIARIFAPELRPFFRALEDPFGRGSLTASAFNHPFFTDPNYQFQSISPAVDVTESADSYLVHAEIPGVAKENINVSLGDAGRSLSINGRVVVKQGPKTDDAAAGTGGSAENAATSSNTDVSKAEEGANKLYNERTFVRDSSFSRTIQLPYPVDAEGVKAKLDNGVLTITMNKLHDKENKLITVE